MLAHQALLAIAVVALAGAGWRWAGRLTPVALERAVAAAAIAGSAAVVEALLLGRVSAGASPLGLAAAALATLLVIRARVPAAVSAPWWPGLSAPERWAIGAAGGVLVALVAWTLRHPAVGVDGVSYHLPEALAWIHSGATGATPHVAAEFQTGSYPLTNEVLLAWGMALGRSFAWVELWMGLAVALFATAAWVGLRRLGCGRALTAVAVGAVLAEPVVLEYLNTPKNDLPALAWLAACAALCACAAPRRPGLLGPALAAAGLAAGSKTTTVPLAAIALAAGGWACRDALRAVRWSLVWGALAATGVGGVWYLRNLIAHGWPLWPFGGGPFGGDPEPVYLRRIDVSFLARPRATLQGREGAYLREVAGGVILLAGGVLAGVPGRRSRLVLGVALATAIAAVAWVTAPFTGRADNPVLDLSLSTTRYLLPVLAAGAAALALAGRTSRLARLALLAALAWSAIRSSRLGFPALPAVPTLLLGAAAGTALAWLSGGGPRRSRALATAVAVAAVVVAAHGGGGWLRATAQTSATAAAPVEAFFAALPGWSEDRAPVAFWPTVVGPLAGDRLRHPVTLIGGREDCAAIARRARRGWVVVREIPAAVRVLLAPSHVPGCLGGLSPVTRAGDWLLFRGAR